VEDILNGSLMNLPLPHDAIKKAHRKNKDKQLELIDSNL
jgi:hypothetical protein